MIAFIGAGLLQAFGAVLLSLASRVPLTTSLRSSRSFFAALALLYLVALSGWAAIVLVLVGVYTYKISPANTRIQTVSWLVLVALALVALARPSTPLYWDEFIWLSKARLAVFGFAAPATAALDPTLNLIPAGYPALWPLAVAWTSLGQDALSTQVVAGTLLVVACAAVALECWQKHLAQFSWKALALLVSSPLVFVHFRSTYVDLPVGLLALGLLGTLLEDDTVSFSGVTLAVVLSGFKDEGLAYVLAATCAATVGARRLRWRQWIPALVALASVLTWRGLLAAHGVTAADHTFSSPDFWFLPKLLKLLFEHAFDLFSWGVFWAVAVFCLLIGHANAAQRSLRAMLALSGLFMASALLFGPERVRAFAENGTLLNRLLMQLWPAAAMLVRTHIAGASHERIAARETGLLTSPAESPGISTRAPL